MSFSKTWGTGALVQLPNDGPFAWAWSSAFRVTSDTGTAVKLTDILSPLDKRTTIKLALSKIANVYTTLGGDSVPVTERSSNVTGQTLFTELTTILTRPNPTIAGGIIQVPVQARIELRLPNDGELTATDVEDLIVACHSALLDDAGNNLVISEKLRGALVPPGI